MEANEECGRGNLAYMLPEQYLVTQIIPTANFLFALSTNIEREARAGDNAEHLVSLTDSRPLTGSERSIVHPDHPLAGCTDEEINKSFEKPNHL